MESRSPSPADGLIEKVASKTMRGRERWWISEQWMASALSRSVAKMQRQMGPGFLWAYFQVRGKKLSSRQLKNIESQEGSSPRCVQKRGCWEKQQSHDGELDGRTPNEGILKIGILESKLAGHRLPGKGNRHSKWANWGRMWESAISTWLWICMTFGSPLWWDHKSQEGRFFCLLMGL